VKDENSLQKEDYFKLHYYSPVNQPSRKDALFFG